MHHKQNNKESKTYVQGLRPFGNTLPRGLKGILKKNGYNYSEIISKWSILVGKDISNCAYPKSIKMKKDNSNGTLILAVNRGDEINVEYSKKEIIQKINSHFGYKLIDEVKLKTINSKYSDSKNKEEKKKFSKNFQKKIDQIENKNIRESLSELLKEANK
tara:strand:+ start:117 stop:596 length:480 start_codon:yes stop_codon:yes gene_type:complete